MARIKPVIDTSAFDDAVGFGLNVFGYGSQITQPGPGGGYRSPVSVGDSGSIARPRANLPPVRLLPSPAFQRTPDSATPGPTEEVHPSPADVIDPEFRPTATVFEDAPGGIYETNRAPTDWAAVYDAYVILNTPEAEEVTDWGEILGSVIGGIWDPFGAGAAATAMFNPTQIVGGMQTMPSMGGPVATGITGTTGGTMAGCPPTGPKYGKICLATGVVTPLRRRRRRRLLTSSDIKDLSALKSIVGGAALQGAVVQAVRR